MSFIDNIKSLFTKKLDSGIFAFFAPTAIPKMGEKEFLKAYRSWVYACTNAIAERVADIELKFQEKTKDGDWQDTDIKKSNGAMDVIFHVNNFMSFYELVYNYAAFQEIDGNSFWYMPKTGNSKNGAPSEIWPLDPTRVAVVKSKTEFISGYVFTPETGEKVPFEPDEILHFKQGRYPLN